MDNSLARSLAGPAAREVYPLITFRQGSLDNLEIKGRFQRKDQKKIVDEKLEVGWGMIIDHREVGGTWLQGRCEECRLTYYVPAAGTLKD